ncbi:MAG: PAS domain S-box protein [Bacteroidota bacterium]
MKSNNNTHIEESLRESEERYRSLIEFLPDAMAVHSEGKFVFINPSGLKLIGAKDQSELIGTPVLNIVHPDYQAKVIQRISAAIKENKPQSIEEEKFIRLDGTVIDVEVISVPVMFNGKKSIQVVVRDITQRKQMEERLRQSEAHYKQVVEISPNGIAMVGTDGRITYSSPKMFDIFKVPVDEVVIGTLFERWIDPGYHEIARARVRRIIEEKVALESHEYQLLRYDGTVFWGELISSPVLDAQGNVVSLMVVFHDVTERKRAEQVQSAVYRISESAQSVVLLDDLFHSIHGIISELMPAKNFFIAMYDSSKDVIDFPYHADEFDNDWKPIQPGKSMTGYVLRTGLPILVTPQIFQELKAAGEVDLYGTHSVDWIGVPLKTKQNETIGVMVIQTYNDEIRLTEKDKNILVFVSTQVANAIERKQTEHTLRESEHSYAGLFNSVTEAIYIQNSEGYFLDVNDGVEKMYGYSRDEIIGKTPEFLSAPNKNDLPHIIELVGKTFTTGVPHQFEFWGKRKNGEIFPKDVITNKGKYFGHDVIITTARDITDRKRAERALEVSETRYGKLIESLLDGVYKSNHDGKFIDVNPALVQILGYTNKEELMAVDIKKDLYFDEVDRENVTKQELEEKIAVYRLKKKDGSEVWVEDHGRYVMDESGAILFHEGILRDVTERRRAEEELKIAATVYKALGEAIVVTDASNKIMAINPAFTKLTGYSNDEAIGQSPSLLRSGKHDKKFYDIMWKSLNKLGTWQGEIINRKKNGELFDEWLSISSIYNENGEVIQYVALFSDITEQKKMQAQLLQSQKLESLGTLAGGIAHDFNNLLAMLLGNAELLKKQVPHDSKLNKYVDQIIDVSHRGVSISKQLLFFSRQSEVNLQPISLSHIIEEVKVMLQHFIPKTIIVKTDIGVENGIVNGDAGHLHQIILNLCLNAKDAVGDHGTITISERMVDASLISTKFSSVAQRSYVSVAVSDTGTGIDENIIPKIFDPFFTTKEKGKGTGLGLSIVNGLVRSHNGFIDVVSKKGEGTTFTMYLPTSDNYSEVQEPVDHLLSIKGKTILVVDDEELFRNALKENLDNAGCTVLTASDGFSALELYRQHGNTIDVVISDLGMPNMSGEEMYKKLKIINPSVKVIISSGYLDRSIRSQMIEDGIKEVINKPYKFSEIDRIIGNVLAMDSEL